MKKAEDKLSPEVKKSLLSYVSAIKRYQTTALDFASYMYKMDLLYAREAGIESTERVDPEEFVVPIVLPQVESARAYLVNIFLAQDPIFQAAGNKDQMDAATQFNLVMKRDADVEGWRSELSIALVDGLKYNLCCTEVDFVTRTVRTSDPDGGSAAKEVQRQANSLRRIPLHNAVWDRTVSPSKIHTEGAYAGYVEYYSRIALHQMLQDLPASGLQATAKEILDSNKFLFVATDPMIKPSAYNTNYVKDLGSGAGSGVTQIFSDGFFDEEAAKKEVKNGRYVNDPAGEQQFKGYHVFKLYVRIVPDEFGMNFPGSAMPQIWKLIYVNNVLAFAQQQTNMHSYLPMVFGQPLGDGLDYQTVSYAENLKDIQRMASKLWTAELKSTNRVIGDRAIYNPLYIDPQNLRSKSGSSKIPLRGGAASMNFNPALAYYQIPYNDPALGLRMNQAAQISTFGDKVGGQNPAFQGNFVKGNKTDNQFQETVQGTESRMLLMAIMLETGFFTPIKEMIKANILQYKANEVITDSSTGQPLKIDIATLRKGLIEFELGDGLAASAAKAMLPVLGNVLQATQANPALAQEYDVVSMFAYYAKLSGFRRIESFRFTQEQKAMNQQQLQLAAQAAAGGQVPGTVSANQTPTQ